MDDSKERAIDQEEDERKKENISPDLHHNAKNFIGSSKPTRKKTRTKLFQAVDKLIQLM